MSTFDNEIIQTRLYISIKIPRPNYRQNFSRAKHICYSLKPGICILSKQVTQPYLYLTYTAKGKTHYKTKINTWNSNLGRGRCGRYPGADPGFQVKGGALKKSAPSGGRREHFWSISCEKSRFYAKNHIFSNFRGGAPPWIRSCSISIIWLIMSSYK